MQLQIKSFITNLFCYCSLILQTTKQIIMGQCLGGLISCCCCECNWAIFPTPVSLFDWNFQQINHQKQGEPTLKVRLFSFINSHDEKVPYLEISNQKSKQNNKCLIYFHGNAEDIFLSIQFLIPVFKNIQMTIFVLEYPTYSCYQANRMFFISNRIKQNSLQFHEHLIKYHKFSKQSINVMGRSIGTGPATYLASRRQIPSLILISPFDQISSVAESHVGCIGNLLKNHFNNEVEMMQYRGRLLLIHGKMDEVIKFSHGRRLVQIYEMQFSANSNQKRQKAVFIQPQYMSHNNFDMHEDIVIPIHQFFKMNK